MTAREKRAKDATDANRRISRPKRRERAEAAAAKISPAVPPAGAAILADVDPALDDRTETEHVLERESKHDDRRTGHRRGRKNPSVH